MYLNEFLITLSSFVCYTSKVRISLLTVLSYNKAVVKGVFPKKRKSKKTLYPLVKCTTKGCENS